MDKEEKESWKKYCNELNEEITEKNNKIFDLENQIDKLQKQNEKKDKIIYELSRSNVELKGYEIKEEYINNTINFYNKYVENLEINPHWRKGNN